MIAIYNIQQSFYPFIIFKNGIQTFVNYVKFYQLMFIAGEDMDKYPFFNTFKHVIKEPIPVNPVIDIESNNQSQVSVVQKSPPKVREEKGRVKDPVLSRVRNRLNNLLLSRVRKLEAFFKFQTQRNKSNLEDWLKFKDSELVKKLDKVKASQIDYQKTDGLGLESFWTDFNRHSIMNEIKVVYKQFIESFPPPPPPN